MFHRMIPMLSLKFALILCLINVIYCQKDEAVFKMEENNKTCLIIIMKGTVNIAYNDTNSETKSKTFNLIDASQNGGSCSNINSNLKAGINLKFGPNEYLNFSFVNMSDISVLETIFFSYVLPNEKDFPNAKGSGNQVLKSNINMNLSSTSKYYECHSNSVLHLNGNSNLQLNYLKVQAFGVNNGFSGGKEECQQDKSTTSIKTTKTSTHTTHPTTHTTHLTTHTTQPTTHTTQPSTHTTHPTTHTTHSTTHTTHSTTHTTQPTTHTTQPTTHTTQPTTHTTQPTTHTTQPTTHTTQPTTHSTQPTTHTTQHTTHSTQPTTRTTQLTTHSTQPTTHTAQPTTSTIHTTSKESTTTAPNFEPTFSVKYTNGTVCLLLKAEITITIPYTKKNKVSANVVIPVSSRSQSNGKCQYSKNVVEIIINPESMQNQGNQLLLLATSNDRITLTLEFDRTNDAAIWKKVALQYYLGSKLFPDSEKSGNVSELTTLNNDFKVDIGGSYLCNINQTVKLNTSSLNLKNFQFDVFRSTKDEKFSVTKSNCYRSPLVAIIVGVVLAVFLLIVIAIFIVFRIRANRQRGYQEI